MENGPNMVSPEALLVIAALAVLIMEVLVRSDRWRRRALTRLAAKVDLAVPEELRDELRREAAARTRTRVVGAALGVAALSGWSLLRGAYPVDDTLYGMLVAVVATGGLSVAAAVRALVRVALPVADGPRVARASSPGLRDYVAPIELTGSRVTAALPAVAALAMVVLTIALEQTSPGVVARSGALWVALGVPVTLAASEVACRRLLDQPQVATSRLQLAWRDAIRAQVLRDLVSLPLAAGVYGTFAVITMIATEAPETLGVALKGGLGLLAIVVLIVAAIAGRTRPERWFRGRLWPDVVAAGNGETA